MRTFAVMVAVLMVPLATAVSRGVSNASDVDNDSVSTSSKSSFISSGSRQISSSKLVYMGLDSVDMCCAKIGKGKINKWF